MCKCKSKHKPTNNYFIKTTYIGETGTYIGSSNKNYGILTNGETYYIKKTDYEQGVKDGIFAE